jgi:cellulose biosynthesis protein BcsQ
MARREQRRDEDLAASEATVKILAFMNGKGGVGKSSAASAFAAEAASQGVRVLHMELDPQGNNAEDLGYSNSEINDNGHAQAEAILTGKPFTPTGQPRRNLFVVPGGEHLEEVIQELYCQRRLGDAAEDDSWVGLYAAGLEQVYDDYDLFVLDVAPGCMPLQLQALVAADGVIVPSKSDPSSRKGLRVVARRFGEAGEYNDMLALLGVVLFGAGTQATRVKAEIRKYLEADLRGRAPVFNTPIRHVEAVAVQARLRGLVPSELAVLEELDSAQRKSANDLATDYRSLTGEILKAIADRIYALNANNADGVKHES